MTTPTRRKMLDWRHVGALRQFRAPIVGNVAFCIAILVASQLSSIGCSPAGLEPATSTSTSTSPTQDSASQTSNNTSADSNNNKTTKPRLGMAEQNPDASDTVPVYMQNTTIVLVTLHLSVFVTGLVGNSLVCLSVYRNKSLQTITNYYIVNLAVADFLVILICLPPTVYWDLTLTWNFGLVLCKMVLYLQSISVSVSVLTLTCISMDRWYAICRPLKFSSSKSRAKLTIGLIWLASMIIASPDVIFLTTKPLYEEDDYVYMDCAHSWPEVNMKIYQLCIVTLLFVLPFVLMIISYSQIVNVLWRNETMAETLQNSMQLEDEEKLMKLRKNESIISTTSQAFVLLNNNQNSQPHLHAANNCNNASAQSAADGDKPPILTAPANSCTSRKLTRTNKRPLCNNFGARLPSTTSSTLTTIASSSTSSSLSGLAQARSKDNNNNNNGSSSVLKFAVLKLNLCRSKCKNKCLHRSDCAANDEHDIATGANGGACDDNTRTCTPPPTRAGYCCQANGPADSRIASARSSPRRKHGRHRSQDLISGACEPMNYVSELDESLELLGSDEVLTGDKIDSNNPVAKLDGVARLTPATTKATVITLSGLSPPVPGTNYCKHDALLTKCNSATQEQANMGPLHPTRANNYVASRGDDGQHDGEHKMVSLRMIVVRDTSDSSSRLWRRCSEGTKPTATVLANDGEHIKTNYRASKLEKQSRSVETLWLSKASDDDDDDDYDDGDGDKGDCVISLRDSSPDVASVVPGGRADVEGLLEVAAGLARDKAATITQPNIVPIATTDSNTNFNAKRNKHQNSDRWLDFGHQHRKQQQTVELNAVGGSNDDDRVVGHAKRPTFASLAPRQTRQHLDSARANTSEPQAKRSKEASSALSYITINKPEQPQHNQHHRHRRHHHHHCKHRSHSTGRTRSAMLIGEGNEFRCGSHTKAAQADKHQSGSTTTRLEKEAGAGTGSASGLGDRHQRRRCQHHKRHRQDATTTTTVATSSLEHCDCINSPRRVRCCCECPSRGTSSTSCDRQHSSRGYDDLECGRKPASSCRKSSGGCTPAAPLDDEIELVSASDEGASGATRNWPSIGTKVGKPTGSEQLQGQVDGKLRVGSLSESTRTRITPTTRANGPAAKPSHDDQDELIGLETGGCVCGGANKVEIMATAEERSGPDPDHLCHHARLASKNSSTNSRQDSSNSKQPRTNWLASSGEQHLTGNGLDDVGAKDAVGLEEGRPLVVTHAQSCVRSGTPAGRTLPDTGTDDQLTSATTTRSGLATVRLQVQVITPNRSSSNTSMVQTGNNTNSQHHHHHYQHSSTRYYKLIESRKKAAKMLIVIVIMFGLCYLPVHFLNILRYTTGLPQNDITTIASLVSHWLCYFNSAVNPLIYNFMSGKFRHEFANLFFCRFLRRAANT